jgi:hypothetical protein
MIMSKEQKLASLAQVELRQAEAKTKTKTKT